MTVKVTLAMMSHLVKHPKNPNGIELDKLNKMSDEEIIDAYQEYLDLCSPEVRDLIKQEVEANHDK